ncbi:MAG: oligosaccharide repeat unit polymerase [Saprospiraceae bacterium]|nr:oligosaccharide repeat unit polymerase [Saprospiraceae bacterium]
MVLIERTYRFLLVICILLLLYLKPEFKGFFNIDFLKAYSLLAILFLSLHFYIEFKIRNKNWIRIDSLFLVGFYVVHFQFPIMISISGIFDSDMHKILGSNYHINFGVWLSLIGILFWLLGYSLFYKSKRRIFTRDTIFTYYYQYKKLLYFTVILFVLFLITAGHDFLSGGIYKGTGSSLSGDGAAPYIQSLFSICIIVLTTSVFLNNKGKYSGGSLLKWFYKLDRWYLVLVFMYLYIFLMIGDRGGPIALISTIIILMGELIKPLKLWFSILILFIGAMIMTLIGLGRIDKSGNSIISSGYTNLQEENQYPSYYIPTFELAKSNRIVFYSLETVPEQHDYFYGKLWISRLLSPIPFLQTFYLQLTNEKKYNINSEDYITYLYLGENSISGEGTSIIADIYLNFGLLGVIICMFFIGVFLKKANMIIKDVNNYRFVILGAIIASLSFYFGRTSFLIILKPLIWSWIITSLFIKRIKYKFSK